MSVNLTIIPEWLEKSTSYLRKYGLHTRGIFRLDASMTEVMQLKKHFEDETSPKLEDYRNVHIISNLMIVFLKELKFNLFNCEYLEASFLQHDALMATAIVLDIMKGVEIEGERSIILYLMNFFHDVAKLSSHNRTNAATLASTVGPTICRPIRGKYMSIRHKKYLSLIQDFFTVYINQAPEINEDLETHFNNNLTQKSVVLKHTIPKLQLCKTEKYRIANESPRRRVYKSGYFHHYRPEQLKQIRRLISSKVLKLLSGRYVQPKAMSNNLYSEDNEINRRDSNLVLSSVATRATDTTTSSGNSNSTKLVTVDQENLKDQLSTDNCLSDVKTKSLNDDAIHLSVSSLDLHHQHKEMKNNIIVRTKQTSNNYNIKNNNMIPFDDELDTTNGGLNVGDISTYSAAPHDDNVVVASTTRCEDLDNGNNIFAIDIFTLNLPQLKEMKRKLKQQLVAFDTDFERNHGVLPSKRDKEPIRDVYIQYNEVKLLINAEEDTYYDDGEITRNTSAVHNNEIEDDHHTAVLLDDKANIDDDNSTINRNIRSKKSSRKLKSNYSTVSKLRVNSKKSTSVIYNEQSLKSQKRFNNLKKKKGHLGSLNKNSTNRPSSRGSSSSGGRGELISTSATVASVALTTTNNKSKISKPSSRKELYKLGKEKRKLQLKLKAFERNFENMNGRKVKYQKDVAKVENDYQRYKELKELLRKSKLTKMSENEAGIDGNKLCSSSSSSKSYIKKTTVSKSLKTKKKRKKYEVK